MALTRFHPSMIQGLLASAISYAVAAAGASTRTITARLSDSVSVRDFGAVGDGVTDDTAALQAALDFCAPLGKALKFPAGVYISGPLSVTKPDASVIIRGEGGTLKNKARTTGGSLLLIDGVRRVDIQGLEFDGNKAAVSGSVFGDALLCIRNVIGDALRNVNVSGCRFVDAPMVGLYFIGCQGVHISGNYFTGCVSECIFGHSKVYDVVVSGNILKNNQGTGIKIHGKNALEPDAVSSNIVIKGNVVDYTGTASFYHGTDTLGIELWGGCFDVAVSGNTVRGHDARATRIFGISLDSTTIGAVTGNTVRGYIGIGLEAANTKHVTYSTNKIYDCDYGFSSSGSQSGAGTFTGNTIRACNYYGMQFYQTPGVWTISGNTFIDVSGTNIFFNGGGAGSSVNGNSFVSESLGSIITAVHVQADRVKILANGFEWQAGTAAGFAIIIDGNRCRVCDNHAFAGAPADTAFIMCAPGGNYLVAEGNSTFQYNGATVDTTGAGIGFGWVTNNYNDLGGNPAIVKTGAGADNTNPGNQQFS